MIDFCLTSGKSSTNNELELIIQQIDMLFDTTPNEVLGDEHYGSRYDRYLHELKISNEGLRQQVLSDLSEIELFDFNADVQVYLLEASMDDIALIHIILTNDTTSYEKTYKIS